MGYVRLGDKPVGSIVKIAENGVPVDYLIVHQGRPSELYDVSCDGTWVLRKDIAEERQWHTYDLNDYAASTIKAYLDSTFLSRFDANIQSAIKQVKIPYRPSYGASSNVNYGESGLLCKAFLLSGTEIGLITGQIVSIGTRLSYFEDGNSESANYKRVRHLDSVATGWWIRSPSSATRLYAGLVKSYGEFYINYASIPYGVLPAFILPAALWADDSGTISVNAPPTSPTWCNLPDGLLGGSQTTISWGGASDPDGNLAGYKLERSVNSGGWGQVYQGGALSFVDNLTFGWGTVQYRVKSYDSYGQESAYAYSAQRGILNNRSPNAPGSITVPDGIRGGSTATITWAAGSDPDGNLSGYRLEQSVGGGGWGRVYEGTALSHSAPITYGWTSVQYRVKSYDGYGWESGYTTSPVQTVINNRAPVISDSDRALGSFAEAAPVVAYTITDADNDTVTITEKLDGQVLRTYTATLGAGVTLPISRQVWMTTGNGNHTLQVIANDGRATATRTWTFVKAETVISFTLAAPQETAEATAKMVITPTWQVAGARVKIEVCNNGFDAAPTWEDATVIVTAGRVYYLQNAVKTAGKWGINLRFTLTRNGTGEVSISGFGGAHE